jgi:formamidopyrimidine-DNA glycosylase
LSNGRGKISLGTAAHPRHVSQEKMPELAEVEYFRKQWDAGLRRKIARVALHAGKRLFRGVNERRLRAALTGASFLGSEARAKLMCFRFSGDVWLGIHLGMTGKLRVEPASFVPGKHDHLVIFQKAHAFVFSDPRMFGRVHFAESRGAPEWWTKLPPAVTSPEFTLELVTKFFQRRARLAVKAALLVQTAFPGVGNWMADEILWRAKVDPRLLCGKLTPKRVEALWREAREVCTIALATVAVDFSDPPDDWFYHQRWKKTGICPRDGLALKTATVGGRTTRWCPRCQR